eukprot:s5283_g2.t1
MGKQLPSKKPSSAIFPCSKKGKTRLLLKTNLTKKPVGKSSQTRLWQKVPYVLRMDRMKWKRNLKDLLNADEDRMVDILTEDGFLPDWSKMKCPFCNNSAVSSLQKRDGADEDRMVDILTEDGFLPDWSKMKCPFCNNSAVSSLQKRDGLPPRIHVLLDMNHKAVERMEKSLAFARKAYVESHQKAMSLGFARGKWMEVEADEAVFDKSLLPSEDSPVQSRVMKWERWLGMVARGKPASLVLIRLPCVTTRKRAPGPGAIKKVHWTKIAKT